MSAVIVVLSEVLLCVGDWQVVLLFKGTAASSKRGVLFRVGEVCEMLLSGLKSWKRFLSLVLTLGDVVMMEVVDDVVVIEGLSVGLLMDVLGVLGVGLRSAEVGVKSAGVEGTDDTCVSVVLGVRLRSADGVE